MDYQILISTFIRCYNYELTKLLLKKLMIIMIFSIFAFSVVGNLNDVYAGLPTVCGPGTFIIGFGQCAPCSAGTAQPGIGQSSCNICPAGTFSDAGQAFCTQCPTGQTSGAGASMCESTVGGESLSIDTTALLLATTQSPSVWLSSLALVTLGIGAFVFTRNPSNMRNIKVILRDYLDKF